MLLKCQDSLTDDEEDDDWWQLSEQDEDVVKGKL